MFLVALVFSMTMVLHAPQAVHADERDFVLTNDTLDTVIDELYIARAGTNDDWGDDVLGADSLYPGEYTPIHFYRYSAGYCYYDIKIINEYGDRSYLYGINLCAVDRVSYRY